MTTARADPQLRVLPPEARAEAARLWQDVERRVGAAGLTASWLWTGTFLHHYGAVVPHRFVVAERSGTPVGMALVTDGVGRRHGPIPIATRHLGTAGEPEDALLFVEYNRLLVAPEDREAFARSLMALLLRRRWDELHLDGFAPDDAAALLQHDARFQIRREPCPTMDLRVAREAGGIVEALAPGPRARARRALRRGAPVSGEWAETATHALEILDELVALHQRRWNAAGAPGAFASGRAVAFHRDLALRLLARDAAVIYRARNSAGTLGCVYGFVERGRVLFYQGGMAPSADGRVATGILTHLCCMQAALERGLDEYDFLAGDQRYKRELSNAERELVWAALVRRRPRPVLIAAGRRLRRLWQRAAARRHR